jgi:hypothetical protein
LGSAGKAPAQRALKLITGNNLRDLEKNRHVSVAELYDVEQRLFFPRIAERTRVVQSIVGYSAGSYAAAARQYKCG